jgi:hypothetical protein
LKSKVTIIYNIFLMNGCTYVLWVTNTINFAIFMFHKIIILTLFRIFQKPVFRNARYCFEVYLKRHTYMCTFF